MKKHLVFVASFICLILVAIFLASDKFNNYWKPGGNFFAAIVLQSATSSRGASSSTSNNASATIATSTPTLEDVLQQFQDQIQSLDRQTADLRFEIEINNLKDIFTRTLKRGDAGNDVSKLQGLLARFPELYPSSDTGSSSTVTGFYGSLTKAAVMQFQARAGLRTTGVFDPRTREKFYESLSELGRESDSTEITPIDISPVTDLNEAVGSQNQTLTDVQTKIVDLENRVSELTLDLANARDEIANLQNQPTEPPQQATEQQATEVLVQPPPPPSTSPTSPTAPPQITLTINNISAQNITASGANIKWTTNSPADSRVEFGPTPKYNDGVADLKLVTNHSVSLSNLTKNTTYHYLVKSIGAKGSVATSSDRTFATLVK